MLIKAISKLSRKDRVVVVLSLLVVLIIVVSGTVSLINGSFGHKGIKYPDSGLADTGEFQSYNRKTYSDLPTTIQFPGTQYVCCVSGTPQGTGKDGCSFKYSDNTSIVTCLINHSDDSSKAYAKFYTYLTGKGITSVYTQKKHETGYLNTLHVTYEAGSLTYNDTSMYMLSFRYATGNGLDVMIASLTSDPNLMQGDKKLIDRVFQTLGTIGGETPDAASSTESTVTGRAGEMATGTIDWQASDKKLKLASSDRDPYTLATVNVNQTIADAVFVFSYDKTEAMPAESALISPSGKVYNPASTGNGEIVFRVSNPEKGTWNVKVSNEEPIGEYDFSVLSEATYKSLQEESTQPRDAEASTEAPAATTGAVTTTEGR
jgi:hypothetical protein